MDGNGRAAQKLLLQTGKSELALEWLLLNPEGGVRECARALGVGERWLAQIVASDSFQARYAVRCQELGREGILLARQRAQALQMLAVERGMELLESGKASERFVLEVAKTALTPGQIPPANGSAVHTEQHLHLHVSAQDLEAARKLAQEKLQIVPKKPEAEPLSIAALQAGALVAEVADA